MDNRELVKKLSVAIPGERSYSIDAEEVKEVVIAQDLYYIPFVPPYVAGLINRHGKPHTVLDLKVILESEKLAASKVMVMNHGDDQIAFLITDIERIILVPEGDVAAVPSSEGSSLFQGSFTLEGREVFIINAREVYDRLQHDIRNV